MANTARVTPDRATEPLNYADRGRPTRCERLKKIGGDFGARLVLDRRKYERTASHPSMDAVRFVGKTIPAITDFAPKHYHGPGGLNGRVRNGNGLK